MRIALPVFFAFIGALASDFTGLLFGLGVGYAIVEAYRLRQEVSMLNDQVESLRRRLIKPSTFDVDVASEAAPLAADSGGVADSEEEERSPAEIIGERAEVARHPVDPPERAVPAPGVTLSEAELPGDPLSRRGGTLQDPRPSHAQTTHRGTASEGQILIDRALTGLRHLLLGGNTLVRLGVLILFLGFAFLVQYAVEHDLLPIEWRLGATALAGAVLVGMGWRLQEARRDFALALQGGGVAVLYLTVYAVFRLYSLIPAGVALVLLILVMLLGVFLALRQDAQPLAILSILGGFFAPVLASTGEGSHIALFGYFAILNTGVILLAWFRYWRPLNVVGFLCTFGIAGLWITSEYGVDLFASTQPFLAYYFLCYIAVAFFQAGKAQRDGVELLDATLVFGLPVAIFSLQSALVAEIPFGLAWSAFAYGLFYALAAIAVFRWARVGMRLFGESLAAIAIALGTMVLPFALDATWTGTGWALEGVALVWAGVRQRRELLRYSGVALQIAAAASFTLGLADVGAELPVIANPVFFGSLALAGAALGTSYLLTREGRWHTSLDTLAEPVFLVGGVFWWVAAGTEEILRGFNGSDEVYIAGLFLVATALAFAYATGPLRWKTATLPALMLVPALVCVLLWARVSDYEPFDGIGPLLWVAGLGAHLAIARRLEVVVRRPAMEMAHASWPWLVVLVLAMEGHRYTSMWEIGGDAWPKVVVLAIPLIVSLLISRATETRLWPFSDWKKAYLWGVSLPLVLSFSWAVFDASTTPGNPAPLTYLPVLNPLDMVLVATVVALFRLWTLGEQFYPSLRHPAGNAMKWWLALAALFFWANVSLARTVHLWTGVPFDWVYLSDSTIFQMAVTIFWAALAVTAMSYSARQALRPAWIVAAGLMGAAVVKLFVVDLANISVLARIVTFLVVGTLLLIVGYLAPVPPAVRKDEVAPGVPV
jgi:uncharacterized membrane protein